MFKRSKQEEKKEMALIGVLHQLRNQNKNSDSGPSPKNCKMPPRIRDTNKGLGLAWFKAEPQISSPSDLCLLILQ